jgi:hypothetical protein
MSNGNNDVKLRHDTSAQIKQELQASEAWNNPISMNLYANRKSIFNPGCLLGVSALEEKQQDYLNISLQQNYALSVS